MPKISRPIVSTLLASVVIYTVFDLTQPNIPSPAPHRAASPAIATATDVSQVAEADTTAHFPRFPSTGADPFLPKVLPAGSHNTVEPGEEGKWTLTGIYSISGTLHALVEDPATGETASLQPGDHWRGLHVAAIDSHAIRFENALGQQTQLAFPQPTAPSVPAAGLGPLPPMPVTGPLHALPPLPSVPLPTNNPGNTHP